jgi:hypothetical protein
VTTLKAEVEALGKQPGAMGTRATATGSEIKESADDENAKAIAELSHNKALEGNPLFNN